MSKVIGTLSKKVDKRRRRKNLQPNNWREIAANSKQKNGPINWTNIIAKTKSNPDSARRARAATCVRQKPIGTALQEREGLALAAGPDPGPQKNTQRYLLIATRRIGTYLA